MGLRTVHNINLDQRLNAVLSTRAHEEHQSIEDYTNQILLMYFSIPTDDSAPTDNTEELFSLSELRGVLHDDGMPYEQSKTAIMEERYGRI